MKEKRMLKRFIKGFLCMVMFAAVCIGSDNVKAAESTTETNITINENEIISKTYVKGKKASNKAKKAIAAYKKYLSGKKVKWTQSNSYDALSFSFSIVDINKDGIPELLLNCNYASHYEGYVAVFGYTGKKVKCLCANDEIKYYYPKSGIVETYHWGMENSVHYYKIKNGKAEEIGRAYLAYKTSISKKAECTWNGKKVSAKKFKSLLKKAAGSKKVKVTDKFWHKNTAANRKKMLSLVKW